MGIIVDTSVLITYERRGIRDVAPSLGVDDDVFISVVTVSELLIGVLRADSESRRAKRMAFVERVVAGIPSIDISERVARTHAELHAELMKRGSMIGAHDLWIAATAVHHGFAILTHNRDEFAQVANLRIVE